MRFETVEVTVDEKQRHVNVRYISDEGKWISSYTESYSFPMWNERRVDEKSRIAGAAARATMKAIERRWVFEE